LKTLFIICALLLCLSDLHAQNEYDCGIAQYKKLTHIAQKDSITGSDLTTTVLLIKELEKANCSDYTGKKNGEEYAIATRTGLFGDICLKSNSQNAVEEYIKYMKRHHGSAEEQISFSFERIFVKQPEYVLSVAGYDKKLLDQLEWGFLNNHYRTLTRKNYKARFYQINPKVKAIYPKYKKQIDYLLKEISGELKG